MAPYISRHQFIPLPDGPDFVQATHEQHQANRSHPDRPVKNQHSTLEVDPPEYTALTMSLVRRHTARDENMRRFIVDPEKQVKIIGFNDGLNSPPATTGTSQLNTLCLTDGLQVCNAVAIGGEKIQDGANRPGSKVRLFHVTPHNSGVRETLSRYVAKLRQDGLQVKAAAYGGDSRDEGSIAIANEVRTTLDQLNVPVEFDKMCEKRDGDLSLMGAVIDNDHKVQFVTSLGHVDPNEQPQK